MSSSRNSDSSLGKEKKKDLQKARLESRKLKMEALTSDVDIGREIRSSDDTYEIVDHNGRQTYTSYASDDDDDGDDDDDDDSDTGRRTAGRAAVSSNSLHGKVATANGGGGDDSTSDATSPRTHNDVRVHFNRYSAGAVVGGGGAGSVGINIAPAPPALPTISASTAESFGPSAANIGTSSPLLKTNNYMGPVSVATGSTAPVQSNSSNSIGSRSSSGVLFGKSSSLIFPTGVEPPPNSEYAEGGESGGGAGGRGNATNRDVKSQKVNLLLDQCESVRFPFKKKLMLNSLDLLAQDVPVKDLYNTSLGNTLHKLSLAGNRLSTIPSKLVVCLPLLKTLDLSQCELHQLPERWDMKSLKRLNLSHNRLTDFPEEVRCFRSFFLDGSSLQCIVLTLCFLFRHLRQCWRVYQNYKSSICTGTRYLSLLFLTILDCCPNLKR